jgi:cytochrome c oxidase cbb3-type subunit 1
MTVASFEQELMRLICWHSLFWLAAANMVGALLALLLARPEWGAILGEYGYGRWMALHLNWQLYGWCSLPLVGVLLRSYLIPGSAALTQARDALRLWSLMLALGGLGWLSGGTSGKLFLDWIGLPRLMLVATLGFLWAILAWNYWKPPGITGSSFSTRQIRKAGKTSVLLALAVVPAVLFWSTQRHVYPAIDPGSGGPTGASLLGSTLVIVLILALTPKALGLPKKAGAREIWFWLLFAADDLLFLTLNHSNSSHTDWRQIAGLGSLLVWAPLLAHHLRGFVWAAGSRPWLSAAIVWWALLLVSGLAAFLPGILDRLKFTSGLVAHAHLAMGGLLTSYNMLILLNLSDAGASLARVLSNRPAFIGWQAGLALHLAALIGITGVEIENPGRFFSGGADWLFWLRFLAGAGMAAVSMRWAWRAGQSENTSENVCHA